MAAPAKSRYMEALRDQPSPTERGRSKVLNSSSPPPPPPPKSEGGQIKSSSRSRIAAKWQQMAQEKYQKHFVEQQENVKPTVPKPFSLTSPPPPPPPGGPPKSAARSRRSAPKTEEPPQLMNQRRQWDADRDIPRGTVSNSPFKPVPEAPPPQLRHQKQQWNAERDIPRGTVYELKNAPRDSDSQHKEFVEDLKRQQWDTERDIPKGTVRSLTPDKIFSPKPGEQDELPPLSPSGQSAKSTKREGWSSQSPRLLDSTANGADADVKAADSPKRQWVPQSEIPEGAVSKLRNNRIFFPDGDDSSPQVTTFQKKQWEPEKDIPRGKVKDISGLFGGATKGGMVPHNHVEHLEPAELSPTKNQTQVVKPKAFSASKSDEDAVGTFYMATDESSNPAPSESDSWLVASSSSGQFFGKGTWGESAVTAWRSNDEYDDRDWFQSGSFNQSEEEKKDFEFGDTPFPEMSNDEFDDVNNISLASTKVTRQEETESYHDDDDDDEMPVGSGSFADAIQPVSAAFVASKPETVEEDPEAEAAAEEESVQAAATKKDLSAKAKLLQSPSGDSVGVNSTSSKKSSTPRGFGFRRKERVEVSDSGEKKRRGGLFKIFSRKEGGETPRNTPRETPKTTPKGKSPLAATKNTPKSTPKKKKPNAGSLKKGDTSKSPSDGGSLTELNRDVESSRSKGVISTRDDMTAVSEMTNPTVFFNTEDQNHPGEESSLPTTSVSTPRPVSGAIPSSEVEAFDDAGKLSTDVSGTMPSLDEAGAFAAVEMGTSGKVQPDPFDLNSPLFSSSDPFADLNTKSPSGSFSDPFFPGQELDQILNVPRAEGDDMEQNPEDVPDPEIELLPSDDEAENEEPATDSPIGDFSINKSNEEKQTLGGEKYKALESGSETDTLPSRNKGEEDGGRTAASVEPLPLEDITGSSNPLEKSQFVAGAKSFQRAQISARSSRAKAKAKPFPESKTAIARKTQASGDPIVKKSVSPILEQRTSQLRPSVSVDSDDSFSKHLKISSGSNLTLKMRMKRYEKKMQQTRLEKTGNEEEKKTHATHRQAQVDHVSTSAYLSRFKPKATKSTIKGRETDDLGLAESSSSGPASQEALDSTRSIRRKARSRPSEPTINQKSEPTSEATALSIPAVPKKSLKKQAKPRSILKKSKLAPAQINMKDSSPASSFDEDSITDPMHRAGLRLLAAAVIPIQAEMRRFIAKREALNRMWAIIVIQASFRRYLVKNRLRTMANAALTIQISWANYLTREYARVLLQSTVRGWLARKRIRENNSATCIQSSFRGWVVYKVYWRNLIAAIQIQAMFRGWLARDYMEDQHYCATQIQRIYRGYVATMSVYEDIYKVTLVQSYVRMKIAMESATYRLAFIIQVQSIIRGYLVRKRLELLNEKAVIIQALTRGFLARLNYRFDLLDIIMVQSLFRKKKATRELEGLREEQRIRSATLIQSRWRSYDCTMNYLHYLADVLIVQSVIRRWSALRLAESLRDELHFSSAVKVQAHSRGCLVRQRMRREKASMVIQRTWRGFVCYAEYMFTIADIVITQSQARCWLARRRRRTLRDERNEAAATKLQSKWRCCICRTETKQKMVSLIRLQAVARMSLAKNRCRQARLQNYSAGLIQRTWLMYLIRTEENAAAISIQRIARGSSQRVKYAVEIRDHRAAVKVQSVWRRFWSFSTFVIMLDSAITIQSIVRMSFVRSDFKYRCRMATLIQSRVRILKAKEIASAKSMVSALVSAGAAVAGGESDAATVIQSVARTYSAQGLLFLHLQSRAIQTWWRGIGPRYALKQHLAAIAIQALWRGITNHRVYSQYRSSVRIQSAWRARVAREWYVSYIHARKVQAAWRACVAREKYVSYMSARKVQSAWRKYVDREKYLSYISARKIQSAWRKYVDREKYVSYISARKIQSAWRMAIVRINLLRFKGAQKIQATWRYHFARERYLQYLISVEAATMIQSAWRSFICYTDFIFTLADIVTVQRVARGWVHRKIVDRMLKERDRQRQEEIRRNLAATVIQRNHRGGLARFEYRRQCCAIDIQRSYRGYCARVQAAEMRRRIEVDILVDISATAIQSRWRGFCQKQKFWYTLGCVIQIQCMVRAAAARYHFADDMGCIIISQSAIRRWLARQKYKQMRLIAVLVYSSRRQEVEKSEAARTIQIFYRIQSKNRIERRAAVKVQSFFRMVKAMVDKEIKAAKKRRKLRKQKKQNSSMADDSVLESVWDSISVGKDNPSLHLEDCSRSKSAPKHRRQHDAPSLQRARDGHRSASAVRSRDFAKPVDTVVGPTSLTNKKNRLPPSYYSDDSGGHFPDAVGSRRSVDHEIDSVSEVSVLTTPSVFRVPPSRLERMGKKEMAEDLSLEEAWVDMEIQNVKEKRRNEKLSSKGRQHLRTRSRSRTRSEEM